MRRYTKEAGVRSLEREMASICRKVAREVVKARAGDESVRIKVGAKQVRKYLGVPRFQFGKREDSDQVGICTGLAFTETAASCSRSRRWSPRARAASR